MTRDQVAGRNDHDRTVEHAQNLFSLRDEINVTRGVEQSQLQIFPSQIRLVRKDRDAAFSFKFFKIQKGISVVDSAEFFEFACLVEQGFRQRGLARIDRGDDAGYDMFQCCLREKRPVAPFVLSESIVAQKIIEH